MIEILNFLRLAGYYRRFIKGFSIIETPFDLADLEKSKVGWTRECE
jgi:hypothetical protein